MGGTTITAVAHYQQQHNSSKTLLHHVFWTKFIVEDTRQNLQETNWRKYDADEETVSSRKTLPSLQELPSTKHETMKCPAQECYDCRDNGE